MTLALSLLAVSALGFFAGWRARSSYAVREREARRELGFLLSRPIEAEIIPIRAEGA